jgi:general stress protein 26
MRRKDNTSIDRVWDIIEKVGIAMLTTSFPGGLRARPVEARPERNAGLIWFVTDIRSGKEREIEAEHDIGLVFIDPKDKAYLSITARAEVRHDHAKAAEIWKSTDDMWWKGPNDPNVCRRRVRIRQGTDHRPGAKSRREPQGDGEDVMARAAVPRDSVVLRKRLTVRPGRYFSRFFLR